MTSLSLIIGRSPHHYHAGASSNSVNSPLIKTLWHCDLDLGHLRKVSRQHALIIWNFESQVWEVRCLSKKYPVRVGKSVITFDDPARELCSGDILGISSESFFFMLPRQGKEATAQQMEMYLEEQYSDSDLKSKEGDASRNDDTESKMDVVM